MIDLFSIKLNGQYDEIGAVPTINEGRFLCDTTGENYVKGYSYQVTTENEITTVTRTDNATDYKIQQSIYPTIQNVCEWLNNWFTIKRNFEDFFQGNIYGSGGAWHELPEFPNTGDLCKIRITDDWNYISTYDIFFVSYVTVNDDVVTADNPLFKSATTYFYYIMHLPQDVEAAISKMIYFDIFERGAISELKSENIGNYSYTKEDVHIGSLAYPFELVAGLENCYKRMRFIQ
jgi:hypothetical protein